MLLDLVFVQLNFKCLIVARYFLSNSEIFLQLFLTYQLLNSLNFTKMIVINQLTNPKISVQTQINER